MRKITWLQIHGLIFLLSVVFHLFLCHFHDHMLFYLLLCFIWMWWKQSSWPSVRHSAQKSNFSLSLYQFLVMISCVAQIPLQCFILCLQECSRCFLFSLSTHSTQKVGEWKRQRGKEVRSYVCTSVILKFFFFCILATNRLPLDRTVPHYTLIAVPWDFISDEPGGNTGDCVYFAIIFPLVVILFFLKKSYVG